MYDWIVGECVGLGYIFKWVTMAGYYKKYTKTRQSQSLASDRAPIIELD